MSYFRQISTALLFYLVCCTTVSAYVMGVDNRQFATMTEMEIPAIRQTGMVYISSEEFVTGLVTGDNCDVVVTAGHAAYYWQRVFGKEYDKGDRRENVNFQFSLYPRQSNTRIDMQLISSGYDKVENIENDEDDWSIFRLSKPALSNCHNIALAEHRNSCDGTLVMPAFHFDKPDNRLLDRTCTIKSALENNILVHDCDTKDGSSGAPVFCKNETGYHWLGINISGLALKIYEDPGVYGVDGDEFNIKTHKNFALIIHDDFDRELKEELRRSGLRVLDKQ